MPRQGETFVNAVGRTVVAHGGATPSAPPVRVQAAPMAMGSGTVAHDLFGRPYDPAVPVWLPTGTRLVLDRLAFTSGSRGGSPFGMLADVDALTEYAQRVGYPIWPDGEHGMPPDWWLEANPGVAQNGPIAPGYGDAKFPPIDPQLLTNPDFDDGATGWILGPGWSISGGEASADGTQGAGSNLFNVVNSENGVLYRVEWVLLTRSAGSVGARIGATNAPFVSTPGEYVQEVLGDGGGIGVRCNGVFVGSIGYVRAFVVPQTDINLVTNGDFEGGATGWTPSDGWSVSGGAARCDGTQAGNNTLQQSVSLTEGSTYRAVYTITERSAGAFRVNLGGTGRGVWRTAPGQYTEDITVVGNGGLFLQADTDFVGAVDDVELYWVSD